MQYRNRCSMLMLGWDCRVWFLDMHGATYIPSIKDYILATAKRLFKHCLPPDVMKDILNVNSRNSDNRKQGCLHWQLHIQEHRQLSHKRDRHRHILPENLSRWYKYIPVGWKTDWWRGQLSQETEYFSRTRPHNKQKLHTKTMVDAHTGRRQGLVSRTWQSH